MKQEYRDSEHHRREQSGNNIVHRNRPHKDRIVVTFVLDTAVESGAPSQLRQHNPLLRLILSLAILIAGLANLI